MSPTVTMLTKHQVPGHHGRAVLSPVVEDKNWEYVQEEINRFRLRNATERAALLQQEETPHHHQNVSFDTRSFTQKCFSYSPLDFESKVRKVSIPIGGNGCRSYLCFLFVSIYSPEVMNTVQCNFFIRVQIRAITVSFLYLVPWHQTPSKSSLIVSLMVILVVIWVVMDGKEEILDYPVGSCLLALPAILPAILWAL